MGDNQTINHKSKKPLKTVIVKKMSDMNKDDLIGVCQHFWALVEAVVEWTCNIAT